MRQNFAIVIFWKPFYKLLELNHEDLHHRMGDDKWLPGGLRYLRYGSLRGNILGVEAVLADGQVRCHQMRW